MKNVKTAGIICEYNPIHGGHVHHIRETRRLLGEDAAVVCVMSGNFVQRGEAAIFEKHARAEAAVRRGRPRRSRCRTPSSAERFAFGGVSILNALGRHTSRSGQAET